MGEWSFLTNHARVLVCIAHDPGVRLRDIAATVGITERSVFGIVTDLTTAGYVLKDKDGRRNRYRIQVHVPLRKGLVREQTIGELLTVLVDTKTRGDFNSRVGSHCLIERQGDFYRRQAAGLALRTSLCRSRGSTLSNLRPSS